ncbi:non-ribosomal peptide synthetase [Saccharopolyspora hirsuta]|uniref:non-ribosomal peptide synthetase n=1 Tax=Saccharopolyspora hirsuta TaxID=1837 RepID=UPI00332C57BF
MPPREFWAAVVERRGTPLPRWADRGPATGDTGVHEVQLAPGAARGAARALGVPVEVALLTAHVKVIAAVTGEPQVLTGYRPEQVVLPCSVALSDEDSWRALASAVHDAEADLRANEPCPADLLDSGSPIDAVLDLSDGPDALPHPLRVRADAAGDRLRLSFRPGEFSADQVERLGEYYRAAIDLMTRQPGERHTSASLLPLAELELQLDGLAGPDRDLPDRRLHELFEERVRAHPDRIAAVHRGTEWSYQQLDERANGIARELLDRGLRPEDVVAVVSDRTLDWMAAVLGIFKAGGCYLPVDPEFPAARVDRMLRRSECRIALTGEAAHADLGDEVVAVPLAGIGDSAEQTGQRVAADQLAYIYFTSGSTGEPKGAMCEHLGMLNHVLAKIEDFGLREGAVIAQTAPQCFDISLWQLVAALLIGGRTVLVEQATIVDGARFADHLVDHGVEVVQLVPSYLDVVLDELRQRADRLALRCASVTGEAVKKELTERWFGALPQVRLVNAYGLTETSDDTNHEVMTEPPAHDRVPLGPPVRNTRVYVVDEQLRPVPLGAPGEIVFSGICVGRGYINDEERTRAVFLPDPHRPGNRLYRSGDLGRWLPGGKLEFLGRRDAQVKIRGFRIEIGEIENELLRIPRVGDSAVVVSTDPGGGKHLVAFHTGPARPAEQLAAPLAQALPDYMVPERFHHLDALPVNDNGKIDRKALTELADRASADAPHAPPETPTEQRLALLWSEVLGVPADQIGREDDFFARGGTSLSAIQLLTRLEQRIALRDFADAPVLASLAALLDERPTGKASP